MHNGLTGKPVEKHPRSSGRKQGRPPIPEARREPTSLKEIKHIVPTNGVKSFPNIELEE
jgi:hypothetical protein